MKNEYTPDRSPRPAVPGDVITLGSQDQAAEPVQAAANLASLEAVWQRAISTGTVSQEPGDPVWLIPRGARVRVLGFDRSRTLNLRCARVKVLTGPVAGLSGWIAAPRSIDPLSSSNAGGRGEWLVIAGEPPPPKQGYPALLGTSVDSMDDLLDVFEAVSRPSMETLIRMGRVVASPQDVFARVKTFGASPRRHLSCAAMEVLFGPLAGRELWLLMKPAANPDES